MHTHTRRRRTDALDYMQAMLGQIRTMAKAERCDMLAYLIEMAYLEVSDIIRGERPLNIRDHERDSATTVAFKTTRKVKFQ
jgi:hypothetical protein